LLPNGWSYVPVGQFLVAGSWVDTLAGLAEVSRLEGVQLGRCSVCL